MLYIQDGRGNSFQLEDNQYYWGYLNAIDFPYLIVFNVEEAGTIIIEYNSKINSNGNPTYFESFYEGAIHYPLIPNTPLQIYSGATGRGGYIDLPDNSITIYGLKITFIPGEATTSTTSTTTSTTTLQPIGSKVFIHVGDINIPDNNCGRYKLTLDGAQSNYFSIYGKRVYLTTYPSNTGTYSVNICAKDLANRFTPVCDTFDLTIKKCEFTTEPPTTTAAPSFAHVQSNNSVSPVNQYTYNKIYGMKKK